MGVGPSGTLGRCPSANLGKGNDSTFLVGWQDGGATLGQCQEGGTDLFAGKARAKHLAGLLLLLQKLYVAA